MEERGKELFDRLHEAPAIKALIGQSEDVDFDCKEWPNSDSDAQKMLAKAACGLTNSDGGVLLIGMRARAASKDEPDLVDSLAIVSDTSAVKSRVLDLIGQLVEPRVEGIQVAEVNEPPGSQSGFVVIYVPASHGSPRRSRKDWKFYQRIGSGTFPMEYFQIEERFGKRPPPKLDLHLEMAGISGLIYEPRIPARWFVLGIKNLGAGIAKFPSIRYKRTSLLVVDNFGIDGAHRFGLPQHPSEAAWESFRGGVDNVIYPEETLKITKVYQRGEAKGADGLQLPKKIGANMQPLTQWIFKAVKFECELSCEGMPTQTIEWTLPEQLATWQQ